MGVVRSKPSALRVVSGQWRPSIVDPKQPLAPPQQEGRYCLYEWPILATRSHTQLGAAMADTNIDRFDRLTGAVFARLYESFPVGVDLDVMEFSKVISPGEEYEEVLGQALNQGEFFNSAVVWLQDAGFITFSIASLDNSMAYQCRLTAKALQVLKSTPESIGGETLGGRLGDAVKQGTMGALKTVANEALNRGVGFAFTAAASVFSG